MIRKRLYYGGDSMGIPAVFAFINMIVFIGFMFIGIYGFILFVKLAKRGIEALDIYIDEKKHKL